MLHVTDRPSCGAFTVLVVLALIHSCRGQSKVIGPSQPIMATLGDDVVLPCRLEPVLNAADMTVEWARPDLDPRFVLVWRDGKELESKKHPSYRGRTSLSTEGLKLGDASLKLSTVEISDEGTYRCFFPELDRASDVQLLVGAVSSPVIQTSQSGGGGGGVLLQCESEGWYPEPEVLWLDGEGVVLSAGPTETLRRPDDLYTVSSRLTVDQRPSSNFTCRVQQKSINQTRETHVHVPDHFFMVPSIPSTPSTPDAPSTSGVVIGSVIAAFIALFIAALLFVVWKWKQKRSKLKRRSPEDPPDQKEEKTVSSKSDNTGSQVVMEGEGEREPLMAGREEENNVDVRAEEGERKDETHHGELVTEPDVDGSDGGRGIKSMKQDEAGRQVKNDGDEGGGEQTVKPVEEDSGLPLVLVEEGPKESNVHQEVQKEQETRQDPMNDVDKKEAKKENEQKEVSFGRTGQKKNWRERMQPEVGRRSVELQSKTQKRKDEMKLKQQKGGVEDRKQEGKEAEHKEKIEKHQEGNQSDRTMTTTGREAENQKETEEKRELQRQEVEARDLRTPEGALDASRQEAEHLDEKGKHQEGNQSDRTTTTGRKAENQKELINETVKETEDERQEEIKRDGEKMELKTQEGDGSKDQEGNQKDFTRNVQINEKSEETEREKKPPSAGREETRKRPGLRRHQETAGREHQELQQEEESEPERCTMGKGRREDGTDEGADVDENQQKSEEMRRRGQQQQQEDVIEEVRQQPEESSQRLTDGGVKSQEEEQEELMEVNTSRPRLKAKRGVRQQKQQQKVPVGERRKKHREEGADTEDFHEAKIYVMSEEDQQEEMEVELLTS